MSTEQTKKSGRTPEQQAARDARKAAKAKLAESATTVAQPHAESSTQAVSQLEDGEQPKSEKKRRREDDEENNDPSLLEINVGAPEPLSKAEARAAKKRQKKGLPELPPKVTKTDKPKRRDDGSDSEGDEEVKQKEEKKAEEAKSIRQNSVWIGNLSFRTTAEGLKTYLENGIEAAGGNKLGCITRVNMPKKAGKGEFAANKGFAYVDFATPELQALGVGLSESFFEGRKLLIKLGNDHTVTPDARTPRPERAKLDPAAAGILKKQIHPESATLFVGNLPFDATEEGLRDLIEENAPESAPAAAPVTEEKADEDEDDSDNEDGVEGEDEELDEVAKRQAEQAKAVQNLRGGKKSGLRKVRLGAFEDTGRCKGFAFLDFMTPQDATRSLTNRKNHYYAGRRLNVQYASEDATKRSGTNRNKEQPRTTDKRPKSHYAQRPADGEDNKKTPYAQRERTDRPPRPDRSGGAEQQGGDEEFSAPEPKKDQRGKRWEATGRPRPGAALAMAKREKVGIVKGEGEKIVFD